jgi:hypothetical protein
MKILVRFKDSRGSIELIKQQVNTENSLTDSQIEKLGAETVAIRSKVSEWTSVTRSADSTVMHESSNIVQLSPSAVCVRTSDDNVGKDRVNTPCSCQSGTSNVCVSSSMNADHVNAPVEHSSANSCLSNCISTAVI